MNEMAMDRGAAERECFVEDAEMMAEIDGAVKIVATESVRVVSPEHIDSECGDGDHGDCTDIRLNVDSVQMRTNLVQKYPRSKFSVFFLLLFTSYVLMKLTLCKLYNLCTFHILCILNFLICCNSQDFDW